MLQNLHGAWEIMAVVCQRRRINCKKWELEVLKGTEKNPCKNACIFFFFFQAWHLSKIVHRTSLCGKLHALFSLWNDFAFLGNSKLRWNYDIKSQLNPPHWCNQSNGTHWKPRAGNGFSPKHLSSSRRPLCRQPDSCVLRALCQMPGTQCTVTLHATIKRILAWSKALQYRCITKTRDKFDKCII